MMAYLSNFGQSFSLAALRDIGMPLLVLLIIALLILPLPTFLLDILFTINIIVGLMIVMIALNTRHPLEFSSFPSVLLIATLLRLGLNVASTRIVLVNGHNGTDSAGYVIAAFGEFVISGNYVVGFIIFMILMIINFIVVTKGAGRVSEVIARFTLDAMPGKQMAIDADLNAGLIDQDDAKQRRAELSQESDFFGSMDGASKFVRGDAVAGLLILVINIVGGLVVGTTQHDLSLEEAGKIYVLLTIGDGLVAQIPSLLLSFATAVLVTRVTTKESTAEQAGGQMANENALFLAAGIIIILGIIPGMPYGIFLPLGVITAGLGFAARRSKATQLAAIDTEAKSESQALINPELGWDDLEQVDVIGIDIGYGLVPMANAESGGQLLTRIKGIRKKLSAELGFLVQPIRIRDNLDLKPDVYQIIINGVVRGSGELRVGKLLAINSEGSGNNLRGDATTEPAFGLPAVWIDTSQSDVARGLGYTVVDGATTMATHLSVILKGNANELLGQDEAQQLLDRVAKSYPKLVTNLIPNKIQLSTVTQILQNLLSEGIPVKDMRTITEALTISKSEPSDADALTAEVRPKLGRMIIQPLIDPAGKLTVITFAGDLERILESSHQKSDGAHVLLEPKLAESILKALADNAHQIQEKGAVPVLVVSPNLRQWLAKFVKLRVPELHVLAYTEIPEEQKIELFGSIGGDNAIEDGGR
ncbi:flagellar biosynthesis protein FlhA [Pseudomonadales bacterium]|jgi:flagellar biosynthesis protein FlhA|nr:flagellar biosynthesis protein FlhA [Pseudomonadales bacterium]